MNFIKKYKRQIYFHLVLNLIVAFFITLSSYYHIPLSGYKDHFIYLVHFVLLQFTFFGILYFLSINKYIFYVSFSVLFIGLSLLSFFKYTQDLTISKPLIESIFDTSLLVSIDLVSINIAIYILLILFVLYFIFRSYAKMQTNQLKSPLIWLAFLGIATYYVVEANRLNTFNNRQPYITLKSIKEFFEEDNIKLKKIDKNITSQINDVNFIFILGESVRADHLQLNGYSKATNPLLSKRKNIISYANLYTPLTYTIASVKQLLTNESIVDTLETNELYSIFSILNTLKKDTYWIGNNSIVKGYAPIIESNNNVILIDKFRSIISFNKALDEKMLQPFDSILNRTQNQFITLHMTGSHWYYENRYPEEFRKFKPVIDSKYIPSLEKQEIINSYDNTLLYLDYFINKTIELVKETNTKSIVVYVSDHGEILGENGKWLHAQEDEASKNPAMIVWYSDNFKEAYPEYTNSLIKNVNKPITTDFLYHSILDFYKVQGFEYDKTKSIFYENSNY